MRQKLIKLIVVFLLLFLVLLGLFAMWTWYQMNIGQSLMAGDVQMGDALGGLVIEQTAVLYGILAGFFLLVTIVTIWITYRLVMFPPELKEE